MKRQLGFIQENERPWILSKEKAICQDKLLLLSRAERCQAEWLLLRKSYCSETFLSIDQDFLATELVIDNLQEEFKFIRNIIELSELIVNVSKVSV